MQVLLKLKKKMQVIRQQKYIHELFTTFFENTKAHGVCENKKEKNKQ